MAVREISGDEVTRILILCSAVFVNGLVERDQNVLITGIGGGVATLALQFCVAKGANVFVTSGSDEKIDKAVSHGAKGGVKYTSSAIYLH